MTLSSGWMIRIGAVPPSVPAAGVRAVPPRRGGMSRKHGGLGLGLAARIWRWRGAGVPAPGLGGLKVLLADGEATSQLSVTLAAAGGVVGAAHGVDEAACCRVGPGRPPGPSLPPLATEAVAEATDRRGCQPCRSPLPPHGAASRARRAESRGSLLRVGARVERPPVCPQ